MLCRGDAVAGSSGHLPPLHLSLSPSLQLRTSRDGRHWKPKGFQGFVDGCRSPEHPLLPQPEQRTANSVPTVGRPTATARALLCLKAALRDR